MMNPSVCHRNVNTGSKVDPDLDVPIRMNTPRCVGTTGFCDTCHKTFCLFHESHIVEAVAAKERKWQRFLDHCNGADAGTNIPMLHI